MAKQLTDDQRDALNRPYPVLLHPAQVKLMQVTAIVLRSHLKDATRMTPFSHGLEDDVRAMDQALAAFEDPEAQRFVDDTAPESYTPDAYTPCAPTCRTISDVCGNAECDCGAWKANAERKELASAVVGAMTVGMVKRERCFERFMMTLHAAGFEVVKRGAAIMPDGSTAAQLSADLETVQTQLDNTDHDLKLAHSALQAIDDELPKDIEGPTAYRVGALLGRHDRLLNAIRWALGETTDPFPPPPTSTNDPRALPNRFWFREELRRRAFGDA